MIKGEGTTVNVGNNDNQNGQPLVVSNIEAQPQQQSYGALQDGQQQTGAYPKI